MTGKEAIIVMKIGQSGFILTWTWTYLRGCKLKHKNNSINTMDPQKCGFIFRKMHESRNRLKREKNIQNKYLLLSLSHSPSLGIDEDDKKR